MPQAPQNAPHPLPQTPADAMPHNGYAPQPPMTAAPMPYPDGAPMGGQSLALQGIDLVMDYNTSASGNPAATQPAAWQMGQPLALNHANFQLGEGERVAIMGPSGSGKSTFMNMLGLLDVPTSGEYKLDGHNTSKLSDDEMSEIRNKEIGFIFQGFNLISSLTAQENVELPLAYRGMPKAQRHVLSEDALKRVGLEKRMNHLPKQMSGGQQQRVAIARAVAAKPPIILADEPTGNLDSHSGAEVMRILHELHREGRTVILITHDNEIAANAHRVIRIQDGQVTEDYINADK